MFSIFTVQYFESYLEYVDRPWFVRFHANVRTFFLLFMQSRESLTKESRNSKFFIFLGARSYARVRKLGEGN